MKKLNQFCTYSYCEEVDYYSIQNFITDKELDPIQLIKKEVNSFLDSDQNFKSFEVDKIYIFRPASRPSEISEIIMKLINGEKNMEFIIELRDCKYELPIRTKYV